MLLMCLFCLEFGGEKCPRCLSFSLLVDEKSEFCPACGYYEQRGGG